MLNYVKLVEGNLQVKLPTLWTDGKAEVGRVREEKGRINKIREEKESEKKDAGGLKKGREVATHYVFPMVCGSWGSQNRLTKAVGAEPSGRMREEKNHAVVARKWKLQSPHVRTTFGSWDVGKITHRCGAKHISKSKW